MDRFHYTNIGHSTDAGPVVAWWIDRRDRLHSRECRPAELLRVQPGRASRTATRLQAHAVGRVELDRSVGSVHLSPDATGDDLARTLDRLERRYPGVRWFIFGETGAKELANAAA